MSAPTQPNDIVENFTTQDQDGNTVSLADHVASPVVLFFYPRADTSGCTIEACGFRDTFTQLRKAGVVVLGISRDTVKAQKKFAVKYDLQYPLLADPDEKICDYFGVIKPKNMYGKLVKGIERTTYLIAPADSEGKQRLLHVWPKVKPEGHAEAVLNHVKNAG
ncbi:peroxiredoxin [Granulicella sp. WH15]|uniref:peroxiredoxin n=1 Tax=Granulicella sp. WH15 TaxID=2602070 RepID=UPI00136700D9|nr:peroxiredoxin [Granulicella sp. WH15]QHN02138.1 peroxiredoxin [Granulicella sp. WH15]